MCCLFDVQYSYIYLEVHGCVSETHLRANSAVLTFVKAVGYLSVSDSCGKPVKLLYYYIIVTILVGAPKSVTNKLQRVLNAAARSVTGTRKYDRGLSHLLHTELQPALAGRSGSCISLLWWSTDVSRTRRRNFVELLRASL